MGSRNFLNLLPLTGIAVAVITSSSFANGLQESRSWQFQTTYDKANKSAILDVIERKKGGYYDGFGTVQNVYNDTTIGTQVGCSNNSTSTGNIADNGQAGPSTTDNSSPNISSDSVGNSDVRSVDAGGNAAGGGTVGTDAASTTSAQENSGSIASGIDGSNIDSGDGGVSNGSTNQDLLNNQDNTGNQTAGVDASTACNFAGTNVSGSVEGFPSTPINSP